MDEKIFPFEKYFPPLKYTLLSESMIEIRQGDTVIAIAIARTFISKLILTLRIRPLPLNQGGQGTGDSEMLKGQESGARHSDYMHISISM